MKNNCINSGISIFFYLLYAFFIAGCGGGNLSSANDTPPSSSRVVKLGEIKYIATGSASFVDPYRSEQDTGSCSGTRSITNWGTGTLTFHDEAIVKISTDRHKEFGPSNSNCPSFQQTDSQPLFCGAPAGSLIVCEISNDSYDYRFEINSKTGNGTVKYTHHYTGQGRNHYGTSYGTISSVIWHGF